MLKGRQRAYQGFANPPQPSTAKGRRAANKRANTIRLFATSFAEGYGEMADDSPNTPVPAWPLFDKFFTKPNGDRYSERQRRHIIKRYGFPLIRIGWNEYAIPAEWQARMAELSPRRLQEEPQRRRPGRPRKYQAAD